MGKFCICRCLFSKNIYVKSLNTHIEYYDKLRFLNSYAKILKDHGVTGDDEVKRIVEDIETEVTRRKNLEKESKERCQIIQESYTRLHPDIFKLKRQYLSDDFLALVGYAKEDGATFEDLCDQLTETDIERAYSMRVFTPEFCQRFLEEIVHFENSSCPKGRPNTMNNYGVLLNELGFDDFITTLREDYLRPITALLFPDWGGAMLDSHKAFIVQYKVGEDVDLSHHYDNAEVTLNVALSPDSSYSGGDLYFTSMRDKIMTGSDKKSTKAFKHVPMMGLLHRGQHKHGAHPITSGWRYNLIIWMRASSVRNRLCPMCDGVPDLEECEGFGGGFTRETVDVCSVV